MRKILVVILFFFSLISFAQEQQLAVTYFRNGEYNKAAQLYQKLYENNQYNTFYLKQLITCFQQTEQYDKAETTLLQQLKMFPNQEYLNIELGKNYELQHNSEKATALYEKALNSVLKKPNTGYTIGRTFQINNLLDYALKAYQKSMELNEKLNYDNQIASIYGEKGEIENMVNAYLNMIDKKANSIKSILPILGRHITDDNQNNNNQILKKQTLLRLQSNPKNEWNYLLSWLYKQQKDYDKAFVQEKALFKRNEENLFSIFELGKIAFNANDFETAATCFHFILENTDDVNAVLDSKLNLLKIDIKTIKNLDEIDEKFQQIFAEFGKNNNTINIQIVYADFLTFNKNKPQESLVILKEALDISNSKFQKGAIKIKIADVLVYNSKFNEALIYYSQVQTQLKNHVLAQEARLKVAQTSYYKGDFKWAQTQLKILKGSTSQLIANDALDLSLLIADNIANDTIQIALKEYAIADLLAYQNKNQEAINKLDQVLTNFKEHAIIDEALFKQAEILEKEAQYFKAKDNYLQLITINNKDILVDNAYYNLAELYLNHLNDSEKAKEYYQKIIFDFPSSIYLVDARKKFRKLRGDVINQ